MISPARKEVSMSGRIAGPTCSSWNGRRRTPCGPDDFDRCVECDQRNAEIPGILRNAARIRTQNRMVAVETADRLAARSGRALVAHRPGRIAKERAASFLQDIAAERCHVSKLRACGELQAIGDQRDTSVEPRGRPRRPPCLQTHSNAAHRFAPIRRSCRCRARRAGR